MKKAFSCLCVLFLISIGLTELSFVKKTEAIAVNFVNPTIVGKSTNDAVKLSGIMEKALLQGVHKCYTWFGEVKENISSLNGYDQINPFSLVVNDDSNHTPWRIPLVTGWKSDNYFEKDYVLNCYSLFNGWKNDGNNVPNILTSFGKKTAPPKKDSGLIVELLENIGYEVDSKRRCFALTYYSHNWDNQSFGPYHTNSVCTDGENIYSTDLDGGFGFEINDGQIKLKNYPWNNSIQSRSIDLPNSLSEETLLNVIKEICGGPTCSDSVVAGENERTTVKVVFESLEKDLDEYGVDLSEASAHFVNYNPADAVKKAISYFSDGRFEAVPVILKDDPDRRLLYQSYLTDYYGVSIDCDIEGKTVAGYSGEINWFDGDGVKQCFYYGGDSALRKVNGLNNDGYFERESLDLSGLVAAINDLPTDGDFSTVVPDENMDDGGPSCMSSNGFGSLGWLLCTVVENLGGVAKDLYEKTIEPYLQVEPVLFTNGSDDGGVSTARDAWGTFRDVANVLFALLLLIVILSQITGYGIDNYGIKKILPKLLLAVLLINLSYIICLVFVDLSNMIGNALQDFFSGLGEQGKITVNLDGNQTAGFEHGFTSAAIVATLVGGGLGARAVFYNPALALSLLVSAISVVISGFFLLILFSVREAAILILTVLSPLAFAAIMLPNTKTLFSRWVKIFRGLLLVYPIAGLLIGGGDFVSRLLLGAGSGTMNAIVAAIVGTAPVFFIPTVLRNSLNAVGNIGTRLSGMGDRIGQRTTGAIRNSNRYKDWEQRGADRAKMKRALNRAGLKLNNKGEVVERRIGIGRRIAKRGGVLNRVLGTSKSVGQAQAEVQSLLGQNMRNQTDMTEPTVINQRIRSAQDAQLFKSYQDQLAGMSQNELRAMATSANTWFNPNDANSVQRMRALMGAMKSNGMENDIFKMLATGVNVAGNDSIMSELVSSSNKVLQAYGKSANGRSYVDFMKNGGMKKYVSDKGVGFLDGLDDKGLAQIDAYSSTGNEIMDNDLIVEGLARINSQDAVDQLENMANHRTNLKFNAGQLASFNNSTVQKFVARAKSSSADGANMFDTLVAAAKDIVADPNQLNKLSSQNRTVLKNNIGTMVPGL